MADDRCGYAGRGIFLLTLLFLIKESRCQNITYVGYNITTITSGPQPGQLTVILTGVDLPPGWLTGYLVTTSANCPFHLQLWTEESPLNHTLDFTTGELSFSNAGQHQVNLGNENATYLTGTEKLGFTATGSTGCVAFDFTTVSAMMSSTMMRPLGLSPTTGNSYLFFPYQNTHLFGIMAVIQDTRPTQISYHGFNTTGTVVLNSFLAEFSVMVRDIQLAFGRLVAFHVNIFGTDCQLYYQLWKITNSTALTYRLKYQTAMHTYNESGYYRVYVRDQVVVTEDDKFAILDVSPSPCLVFEFTPNPLRFSASSFHDFGPIRPTLGDEFAFSHFQLTHRFSMMAEIDGVIPPPQTGVTGQRGMIGETGPDGVTGDFGDPGPQGVTGTVGDQGETGAAGDNGAQGSTGQAGTQGTTGLQGFTGARGPKGINGDSGTTGRTGPAGLQGATGLLGPLGPHGIPGTTGQTGPRGDVGDRGKTGQTGDAGPMGIQGAKGKKGDKGEKGVIGLNGATGVKGAEGSTGIRGPMWDPFDINHCSIHMSECDHGCINSPLGYTCTCRTGYTILANGRCQDIDECATENGRCQYFCHNTEGSYSCTCPHGYTLSNDRHRCDDINECLDDNGGCATNQMCINTWAGHLCVGPYTAQAITAGAVTAKREPPIVTKSMFIGIIIWLCAVSFLLFLEVIILLPELNRRSRPIEVPPQQEIEDSTTEFYFPTFFPRVRLGMPDYYNTRSVARSEAAIKSVR